MNFHVVICIAIVTMIQGNGRYFKIPMYSLPTKIIKHIELLMSCLVAIL